MTRIHAVSLLLVTAFSLHASRLPSSPSGAVIVVWSVTSPADPLPRSMTIDVARELKRAAANLGLTLQIKTMTGRGFPKAFRDARASHVEPDVLVFTNMSVLKGLPRSHSMGPLDGIDDDPEIAASLVKVSETLDGLRLIVGTRSVRAWKYLVATSPHYEAARSLATPPIACASNGLAAASRVAQKAVAALLTQDEETLNALSGGQYPDDSLPIERPKRVLGHVIPPPHRSIFDTKACDAWGNQGMAAIAVTALVQGDSEIGYENVIALVNGASGFTDPPTLMALGRSPRLLAELHDVRLHPSSPSTKTLTPPIILGPPDRSGGDRMPVEQRPTLKWRRPSDEGSFVYLVEAQDGEPPMSDNPDHWERNTFYLVTRERGEGSLRPSVVGVRAPFGAGRQPYRWRIWAIDRDGNVSRSEWRILFYRN